jgi:hypothetical protein
MAINDNAVLAIDAGNFFKAPVDTAIPLDLLAPDVAWENVGHTSLEDVFTATSEGGEATTLGTLQNKTLRTRYSQRTEAFNITLQQFDEAGLKLYYGSNMADASELADGSLLGVPENPTPTISAFLAIFVDGSNVFALWCPKAEIYRNDDLSIADTESLAGLPVSVKPMKSGTNTYTYAVTPLGTV